VINPDKPITPSITKTEKRTIIIKSEKKDKDKEKTK